MKKTLITLLLAGSGTVLFAQQTTDSTTATGTGSTTGTTMGTTGADTTGQPGMGSSQGATQKGWNNPGVSGNTTANQSSGSYPAYGAAPTHIQHSFSKEVPTGTNAQWEQANDFWSVSYMENGQRMRRYYSMNGQSFAISLPLMASYVPPHVMSKVQELYGDKVYDVTMMNTAYANMTNRDSMNMYNNTASMNSVSGNAAMDNSNDTNNGNTTGSTTNQKGTTAKGSKAKTSTGYKTKSTGNTSRDVNSTGNAAMSGDNTSMNSTTGTMSNTSGDAAMYGSGSAAAWNGDTTRNFYHVRIIENGTVRSEMINEDGSAYVAPVMDQDSAGGNYNNSTQQGINNSQGQQSMQQGNTDAGTLNNGVQSGQNTQGATNTQDNLNNTSGNTGTGTNDTGTGTGTTGTDTTGTTTDTTGTSGQWGTGGSNQTSPGNPGTTVTGTAENTGTPGDARNTTGAGTTTGGNAGTGTGTTGTTGTDATNNINSNSTGTGNTTSDSTQNQGTKKNNKNRKQ